MNVAHHAVYPVWLEMARTELLREQGVRYRDLESAGTYFVVAQMDVRFRAPARYDDVLRVSAWQVPTTSRAKVEHGYELRRDGTLIATATTTLVCVDASGKPRRVPVELATGGDQ